MSKVGRVPETLHELLHDEEFNDYSREEVMQIIVANRWGKQLSDLQQRFRIQNAPVKTADEVTPQEIRQINTIRMILRHTTNACPECGYEATVYNFQYCPLCGTKATKRKGAL